MKYILSLLLFFNVLLVSANEWRSDDDIYYTFADDVSINHFGFHVYHGKKCDLELMLLVVSTLHKELENYQDEVILLNFNVDNTTKFQIKASFLYKWEEEFKIGIVSFKKFLFNKETLDLLSKSNVITISIEEKQKLSKFFDTKSHTFSLKGMQSVRKEIVKNPCDSSQLISKD